MRPASQEMEAIPLAIRREMWFQHDGALQPASTSISEQSLQGEMDRERGHVAWPARSPDLTPLDFFLWGHVKSVVYIIPVNTRQELIERMITAFDKIRHSPVMFARVRQVYSDTVHTL